MHIKNNSFSFYFRSFLDTLKILEINLLASVQTWSFYRFFLVCCNTSNLRFCLFDGDSLGFFGRVFLIALFWFLFFFYSPSKE